MDADDAVRAGPLEVSAETACEGWLDGRRLHLTVRQLRMLALLVRAGGAVVRREALYEAAAGRPFPMGSRAVEMDLWRIRRELGPHAAALRSVRKVGYALDVEALERADVETLA